MPVIKGIVSEVSLITPIAVHHVDFLIPIPLRNEGNLCLWGSAYHQRCQHQGNNAS